MTIRQSFCAPIYRDALPTPAALFAEARRMGYAATEFWGPSADFAAQCNAAQDAGLRIASFTAHRSIEHGLNLRANHARIVDEIVASIELAQRFNIPGLIVFSGGRNAGQADEEARAITAEGLQLVAPLAQAAGVTLNMELLNSKVDHAGYQCDHAEWGADVVRRVGSPNVKLLYDIYHMQIMEGDVIRTLRELIGEGLIGHIHTAGNPGRNDLDDAQELNYPAICRAIDAAGYAGFVGHEFFPKGDPIRALAAAFAVCAV